MRERLARSRRCGDVAHARMPGGECSEGSGALAQRFDKHKVGVGKHAIGKLRPFTHCGAEIDDGRRPHPERSGPTSAAAIVQRSSTSRRASVKPVGASTLLSA
jgi:hypothetical protein